MTRLKKAGSYALAFAVSMAATLIGMPALDAQGYGSLISMARLEGKCVQLVMNGEDMSKGCHDMVSNSTHRDSRAGFMFTAKDVAVATFSGVEIDASIDVDKIIVTSLRNKEAPLVTIAAKGTCTYSDLRSGVADIFCSATTNQGAFSGAFVTDGQPPRRDKF